MNILFLFSIGFDRPNPSRQMMNDMLTDSVAEGHRVVVIEPIVDENVLPLPEHLMGNSQIKLHTVGSKIIKNNAFVRRYLDGILYAIKCIPKLRKAIHNADVVYIQSSPTALYNILACRFCSRKVPLVYRVQDMFPGSSIASGVMPRRWMQNVFYNLQKIAYAQSDRLVAISEDMKRKLVEQGVAPEKIDVNVDWFDDTSIAEVAWEENTFAQEYNLDKSKFYVQYAGTMGYVFNYPFIIDVAQQLKDEQDIVFLMIGKGSQRDRFENLVKDKRLQNIVFIPLQPQERVSEVYSACDIQLIPLKHGVIGNSVPSKAAALMACKRPVLNSVDDDSEYYAMFNENQIGYSVPDDDPAKAADLIRDLSRNRELCRQMGRNGYAFGKARYSRTFNTKQLLGIFRDVTERTNNE